MLTLVTGGTGFVGAHVVRALLDSGARVRCLSRSYSDRASLDGLDIEIAIGDLRDRESLDVALAGCEALFHCAADYRLGVRGAEAHDLYDSNVEGTRRLLEAARDAGVRRVVHTSSVGALGLEPDGAPATERTPVALEQMIGPYKRSKYLAERVAQQLNDPESGFEVVIVNPSTPVGELDRKPTPTGQVIVDHLRGRMPAFVDTGLNLIDVRDVAAGHLLAFDKGEPGRRYILGCENLTLEQILRRLSAISGVPAPRLRLPHAVPWMAAMVDEGAARLLGRRPKVSLESVRMARHRMWFDAARAIDELGLPQSPVDEALRRAVQWFRQAGMA